MPTLAHWFSIARVHRLGLRKLGELGKLGPRISTWTNRGRLTSPGGSK